MLKILATTALAAAAAHGLGLAGGVFGGAALPDGEVAARGNGRNLYGPLSGGDAGSSAAWGGRALAGFTPALSVEFAVAYHHNHGTNHWEDELWLEEPKLTLVPITLGGRYEFALNAGGVYVGAGAGYFLESLGLVGSTFGPVTIASHGDVKINAPGVYAAVGLTYRLGKFELDAGPRLITVWNKGDYDYTYEATQVFPPTYETETRTSTVRKDFNDRFVDVLAGVNYYFM